MYFGSLASNPLAIGLLIFLGIQQTSQYIRNGGTIQELLIMVFAVLVSITFHEFAHAFVADKLGDDLPRKQGRLTLNPLAHLDPIGFILLLFAGFGWGKPVNTNPYNYKRTISMKKGSALVSLAGPLTNFVLALVFAIIYALLSRLNGTFWTNYNSLGIIIKSMIRLCYTINFGLGVFNLIPLPPLDGSKILVAILPEKASEWYRLHQDVLYIVFVFFWITPLSSFIMTYLINFAITPYEALINAIIQIG